MVYTSMAFVFIARVMGTGTTFYSMRSLIVRFINWEYSWTLPVLMTLVLAWLTVEILLERQKERARRV